MKISDEVRVLSNKLDMDEGTYNEMRELADRIDNEMVELPKDKSGVHIHVGDTVYSPVGKECCVKEIAITQQGVCVKCKAPDTTITTFSPYDFAHELPDSLERIADELEAAYVKGTSSVSGLTLHSWADRIRKLVESEDEHEN